MTRVSSCAATVLLVVTGAFSEETLVPGPVDLTATEMSFSGKTFPIAEKDLTGYDRVAVDVVNLGPCEDELYLQLSKKDTKPETSPYSYGQFRRRGWFKVGKTTWTVPLEKWPDEKVRRTVGVVHVFNVRGFGAKFRFTNIRLLKPGEAVEPGVLSSADEKASDEAYARFRTERRRLREESIGAFSRRCRAAGLPSSEMLVGWASSMEQIRPIDPKSLGRVRPAKDVRLRLARDEYESLQLIVTPADDRPLRQVSVETSALVSGSGASIPRDGVKIAVTGYVKTRGIASYCVGGVNGLENPVPGWWADPILDYCKETDIRHGVAQSFWVRVKCPADLPAGEYRGEFTVRAANAAAVKVPWTVRVNGFSVSRSAPMPLAITFSPSTRNPAEEEDAETMAKVKRAKESPDSPVNIWKKRRVEWSDFMSEYYIGFDNLYYTELKPNEDFDMFERQLKRGRKGMLNLAYWGELSPGQEHSSHYENVYAPMIQKVYDEAKRCGVLDRTYMFGADEVHVGNSNKMAAVARGAAEIKRRFPGVPLMSTAFDGDYGVGTALSCIDIFVPLANRFDLEKAAKARAEGRKVWWYLADGPVNEWAGTHIENPPIDLRSFMGAQTARMKPDGFLFWKTTVWNSDKPITGGPFTQWETRTWLNFNGQGAWTAVGPDGTPLATLRLENFRDGLEDLCYVQMLAHKLAMTPNASWADKAKALLAVPQSVMVDMTHFSKAPSDIYAWRDAMADLLEK